jgi:esterase/lipase superfamily enzyme
LRELGDALADQGKFEEAEALLRRGLNMLHSSQHSVTEDKSHLVPTLARLVSVLFAQRKTEEGEKLYREAVKAEKTRRRLLIIQTRHDNSLKKVHGGPAYKAMHVFYGTDRDVDTSGIYTVAGGRTQPKVHRFTDERGRELKLGRATVTIPKSHRFGALELPFSFSIPFTSVQISAAPFGHLHFTLPELEIQDLASFRNSVASINSASNPKEALIFVHGYNMDLDNALFRAAQLAFDLKHDGFTAAYSWPSNGDYLFSRESARQAVTYFKEFIDAILTNTSVRGVKIIAHSMGNQLIIEALHELSAKEPLSNPPNMAH